MNFISFDALMVPMKIADGLLEAVFHVVKTLIVIRNSIYDRIKCVLLIPYDVASQHVAFSDDCIVTIILCDCIHCICACSALAHRK